MSRQATRQKVQPESAPSLNELAEELRAYREVSEDGRLVIEAATELPTRWGTFLVRLFRFDGQPQEHLALSVGTSRGPKRCRSGCTPSA